MARQFTNNQSTTSVKLPTETAVVASETPFNKRYCCWFCGEPSHVNFTFPPHVPPSSYHETKHLVLNCPHPQLSVPCCGECQKLASKTQENDIWAVNTSVKKQLLKRYAKHLAIGVNWTQDELANCEFEGGNFAGFAKSAWFVYEVAKGRVNYIGWPLVIGGIELAGSVDSVEAVTSFNFDGVVFPSVREAIKHYANIFLLDEHYVSAVLLQIANGTIDEKSFAQAIRFCRLLVNATSTERKAAFKTLVGQVS